MGGKKKTSNLSSTAIKVCRRSGCPSLDFIYLFIFLSSPPCINMHLMDFNECEKQKAAWCHILFATRGYVGYEEKKEGRGWGERERSQGPWPTCKMDLKHWPDLIFFFFPPTLFFLFFCCTVINVVQLEDDWPRYPISRRLFGKVPQLGEKNKNKKKTDFFFLINAKRN